MRVVSLLLLVIGTVFLFFFGFKINLEGWNTLGLGLFFWILSALIAALAGEPYFNRNNPS